MRPFVVETPPRVFEPRTPSSEAQFEEQVLRVASLIMPSYKLASWKPRIRDWEGHAAEPDLAMVSFDLDNWYVIEVELASHSVTGHIAPQLETLRNGVYDRTLVPSLKRAFPTESTESLTRLVGRDPGLLCIVDQYTERISRACRGTGFDLIVLEPYYGELGGWAVCVERLPYELSKLTTPTTFALSRGDRLGQSVVMELPRNFPASLYKIRLPSTSSDDVERFAQVQRFARGPGLVLAETLVHEYSNARVEIVDPSKGHCRTRDTALIMSNGVAK